MNRDLPPSPVRRPLTTRIARGIVAAAVTVTIACSGWLPATADQLDDRKDELNKEMAAQAVAVDEAHAHRSAAVDAAAEARQHLADAKAALARAESEQKKAEELDATRAEELRVAEAELKQAKADVAAARAALDSVNKRLDEEILVTTQQNNGLLNLALIFSDVSTSDLNQRAQLAETLFDSSQQELDELEMRRLTLEDAESAADAAEKKATDARDKAAAQLQDSKDKTEAAEDLKAEVTRLSKEKDAAEAKANADVVAEEKRQRELEAENASVEKRILERIAREKAAAEKAAKEKAAREKAAREKAARDKAAAERAAAASRSSKSTSQKSTSSKSTSKSTSSKSSATSSTAFMYPVPARITSKYGMRLHPVLGYWKLHDGTDFGASCGTPIKAAYGGVVSERYYNGGYGNRLMIDHGSVNGSYVTTGYNHATRYVVSVGQRVSKGQVIGYVGSTGYSTGCHLHLMVWENGNLVNPMAKWFG